MEITALLWGKSLTSTPEHNVVRSTAVPNCKPLRPTASLQAVLDGSSTVFCQLPFWFHGKRYMVSRAIAGDPNPLLRQRGRLIRVGSTSPWSYCHVFALGKLYTTTVSLQLAGGTGLTPSVGVLGDNYKQLSCHLSAKPQWLGHLLSCQHETKPWEWFTSEVFLPVGQQPSQGLNTNANS